MFPRFSSVFDNFDNLFISKEGGSAGPSNPRALWSLIFKDFDNSRPTKLISHHKALN
jgi:hypothetical protein